MAQNDAAGKDDRGDAGSATCGSGRSIVRGVATMLFSDGSIQCKAKRTRRPALPDGTGAEMGDAGCSCQFDARPIAYLGAAMISAQQQATLTGSNCPVAFDNLTRQLYATDASIYRIEPEAVAFPRGPRQACAIVE